MRRSLHFRGADEPIGRGMFGHPELNLAGRCGLSWTAAPRLHASTQYARLEFQIRPNALE